MYLQICFHYKKLISILALVIFVRNLLQKLALNNHESTSSFYGTPFTTNDLLSLVAGRYREASATPVLHVISRPPNSRVTSEVTGK